MRHCVCLLILAAGSAVAVIEVASNGKCPKDWVTIGGSCYRYFSEPLSFQRADLKCKTSFSSRLISIHSKEEACAVAKFAASQKQNVDIWIGLYDPNELRLFAWADRSRFNIEAWEEGQPGNLKPNEGCVQLLHSCDVGENWEPVQKGDYGDHNPRRGRLKPEKWEK